MKEQQHDTLGKIGYRPFWVFALSILVRGIHLLGASLFISFFLIGPMERPSMFTIYLVSSSGIVLLLTEWMRHREIYREFAGCVTFIKLLLIGLAYHGLLPPQSTLITAFLLAAVAAHTPRILRHRLLY